MFYSHQILAKKGPLGTIWIAAHMDRKLRKNQIADTCIGDSVGACPLWWRPHGFQTRETYVQRAKWAAVARTPSRWLGRLRACGSTSVCRFRVVPASPFRDMLPGNPRLPPTRSVPAAQRVRKRSVAGMTSTRPLRRKQPVRSAADPATRRFTREARRSHPGGRRCRKRMAPARARSAGVFAWARDGFEGLLAVGCLLGRGSMKGLKEWVQAGHTQQWPH